jgi:hypothetical protein
MKGYSPSEKSEKKRLMPYNKDDMISPEGRPSQLEIPFDDEGKLGY